MGAFSLVAACTVTFRRVTYFRRSVRTSYELRKMTKMPILSPGPPACAGTKLYVQVSATIFHKSFLNSFEHFPEFGTIQKSGENPNVERARYANQSEWLLLNAPFLNYN